MKTANPANGCITFLFPDHASIPQTLNHGRRTKEMDPKQENTRSTTASRFLIDAVCAPNMATGAALKK